MRKLFELGDHLTNANPPLSTRIRSDLMCRNLLHNLNPFRCLAVSFAVCFAALLYSPAVVRADVIADSFDDWSTTGTQGENGWENGYYNKTADLNGGGDGLFQAGEFIPFPSDGGPHSPTNFWTGTQWDWFQGNQPWTEIGQETTHPNGSNQPETHWTVRRWTSDTSAPLELTWHMRATNPGGTGVTGRLFQNGVELDSKAIAGNDTTGVTRTWFAVVAAGDTIDLALTPLGPTGDETDGSDGSAFRLTMNDTIPVGAANRGAIVADAVSEFSGVQGQDGWHFGYYDRTADLGGGGDGQYQADEFTEFAGGPASPDAHGVTNHWDGDSWEVHVAAGTDPPWTALGPGTSHPNDSAPGPEQAVMQRWVSDVDGTVELAGFFNNVSAGADGTTGRIFHNGVEVVTELTNGTRTDFLHLLDISAGDTLDLFIDTGPADNDGSDGTNFGLTITEIFPFNPIPEPSTIMLAAMALGGLLSQSWRRRRSRG
jgi:hypothetical protein